MIRMLLNQCHIHGIKRKGRNGKKGRNGGMIQVLHHRVRVLVRVRVRVLRPRLRRLRHRRLRRLRHRRLRHRRLRHLRHRHRRLRLRLMGNQRILSIHLMIQVHIKEKDGVKLIIHCMFFFRFIHSFAFHSSYSTIYTIFSVLFILKKMTFYMYYSFIIIFFLLSQLINI